MHCSKVAKPFSILFHELLHRVTRHSSHLRRRLCPCFWQHRKQYDQKWPESSTLHAEASCKSVMLLVTQICMMRSSHTRRSNAGALVGTQLRSKWPSDDSTGQSQAASVFWFCTRPQTLWRETDQAISTLPLCRCPASRMQCH